MNAAAATAAPTERPFIPLIGYIVVFSAIVAVAMAGLYAFARSGLETDGSAILGLLPITIAILAAGFIPLKRCAGSDLAPLLTALTVTATLLFPILGKAIGSWVLLPLGVFAAWGLGLAIASAWHLIRAHPLTLILGAPAFALVRFVAVNGGQMTHIYAPEYMLLGQPYLDTSFHAALAEMLRNFGVVSVGLDGLVPQFHHMGSHFWLGAVAGFFEIPVIDLYPMALQIVAVPCFTAFFLYATAYLRRSELRSPLLLIVAALTLGFVSSWFFLDKLLLSESYFFSLIIFLSAAPLLFVLLLRNEAPAAVFVGCLILAAVLGIILLVFKVPVGVMWFAAVTLVLVRRITHPRWRMTMLAMLVLTAAGAGAILVTVSLLLPYSIWNLVNLWDFAGGSKKYFLSDLAIIAVIAAVTAWSRPYARYDRREIAGLLAILGFLAALPGSIFTLANTAYYFVNIVAWLALAVAAGHLALALETVVERRRFFALAAVAILILVVVADPDRYKRLSIFLQRVAVLQEYGRSGSVAEWPRKRSLGDSLTSIADIVSSAISTVGRSGTLFPPDVAAALARSPGATFIHEVKDAEAKSDARLAVFVPPDNGQFWSLNSDCRAQPFFIPALTGVPMMMGLSPADGTLSCELDTTYGFGQYGLASHSALLDPVRLCSEAGKRGFDEILVLESVQSGQTSRLVICASGSGQTSP